MISLDQARAEPAAAGRELEEEVWGLAIDTARATPRGVIVFEARLAPLPALAADGFPEEAVRVTVWPDDTVAAFPRGEHRTWKHRNPPVVDPGVDAVPSALCLWYPRDPAELRWTPERGLEELFSAVQRHLIYEEFYRRNGDWPAEDVPHGDDPSQSPYPIRDPQTQRDMRRWSA